MSDADDLLRPEPGEADPNEGLPAHDWLLSILVPLTTRELDLLAGGQRMVFKKLDVRDPGQVRGSAVYCARCELPYEQMTDVELEACRGEE